MGGLRYKCVGGTYSPDIGRSSPCTTPCDPGYFCPNGTSVLQASLMCSSPTTYCPLGSSTPRNTSVGYYAIAVSPLAPQYFNQSVCQVGWYCQGGVARPCPSGRFGNATGVTDEKCSGPCTAGFFCPPGSTSPTQSPCGGIGFYCPEVIGTQIFRFKLYCNNHIDIIAISSSCSRCAFTARRAGDAVANACFARLLYDA